MFLRRTRLAEQSLRAFASADGKLFDKVLVANRGEIACRVFDTCKNLGIKTVAVYSEADAKSKHVHVADEAVCVGPPPSNQSYLQIERIVEACKKTGAQAVHPGYGFLSENAAFVEALEKAGIAFVGPRPHAMHVMGDKILSKDTARNAGVSVVPGDDSEIESEQHCVDVANAVGYPVMVKASAGGGGKGMRIAYNDDETRDAYRLCKAEALSSFGDDRLFVEKFIEEPRHIEIQVLADGHGNVVYLNERECSIQRRNQKVIEEAPSTFLDAETRRAMGTQACQLARAVDYVGAGTVEMLVDKNRNFYFLEMNTRLQVEHPITEEITGVDLVEQMLRVSAGLPLSIRQEDIGINGWALEARVYAENPEKNFLPSTGRLRKYREPTAEQSATPGKVRCDSGIREGSEIAVYYDPMISKLVTWAETRDGAIAKMKDALDSYVIDGVTHNIPFLKSLCEHPRFVAGDLTTNFIAEEYPEGYQRPQLSQHEQSQLCATATAMHLTDLLQTGTIRNEEPQMPEDFVVALPNEPDLPWLKVKVLGYSFGADGNEELHLWFDGAEKATRVVLDYTPGEDFVTVSIDEERLIVQRRPGGNQFSYQLLHGGGFHDVQVLTPRQAELLPYMPEPEVIDQESMLLSPMPGTVISVNIKPGDTVVAGQEVCVLEAMKMQNAFYAQRDGVVKKVSVKAGDAVAVDELIYELEPPVDDQRQAE
ncbi:MAG: hypothetical protein MHM6MM_000487 [Cercozoa sp. M6MM]